MPLELSSNEPSKSISISQDELAQAPAPNRIAKRSTATRITLLPGATIIEELHRANLSAEDDLQLLDTLLLTYRKAVRDNPTGENYEIVEALTGSNQKGVAVIPKAHRSISANGELLDRWGSPDHFHSVSSQRMEIRSAGPDGKLWSSDDVTLQE